MTKLDEKKLSVLDNPDNIKIRSISFEYMLAGISREHAKMLGIDEGNLKRFNDNNTLAWPLLISYPFFVSLANGNSKSLYGLFSPFFATPHGPISISVYELMERQKQDNFEGEFRFFQNPIKDDVNNVKVINVETTFTEIQSQARSQVLEFSDGTREKFENLIISSDPKDGTGERGSINLYKAIDSSLKVIEQQSANTFFDGDVRTVIQQSRFYEGLMKDFKDTKVYALEYSEVGLSKYRAFYDDYIHT
ncbi:hypothetical protein JMG10_03500 [Nostoc ellipsosporum NOK]|nr:hypothetical protein [Nostoc ellipsosporum NOK]